MEADNKKPFKVKDITRNIKKAVVAASLEEIRAKVAEKFEKTDQLATIHLDSDGTEIDDEEYFRTLEANTELIAVFPGEHWIDPSHYVTITTPHDQTDAADKAEKTARIKQLVGQLQNNLCNVSVMSDPDLDSLSNMDPNSLVDITGKDFMEQLKDSGRPLCAKRNAEDRINLLKLLKEGAIFCSERYPEDAEAIDAEIRRQLNDELHNNHNTMTIEQVQATNDTNTTTAAIIRKTNTHTTTTTNQQHQHQEQQKQHQEQTITIVVTDTNLKNDNSKTTSTTTTGNNKSHDI
ncbi:DNA fragmentation factor subunit alpha [Stomoxys calcitrans]|uniref:DNA fragmentation factor subunit alpha n=1 Tax=Stomoxys calcitrans TaxID=35570 RepID=UPI0027E2F052|nr:DNA fragmentation factor subunit alpha [Stomoxys calcitrans]